MTTDRSDATLSRRFDLGRVVATPAVLELAERNGVDLAALLARHRSGDWGDLDAEDKRTNEACVAGGGRILSSYGDRDRKVWIITDAATDACPACHAGSGVCEPELGIWTAGMHFRTDQPQRRLSTTILRPDDY
jgi:hypothetical protein